MIAAVRIRGDIDISQKASRTLENLNLNSRNACVIYDDTESIRGMLQQVEGYVAFGEISEDTKDALEDRKGEEISSGDTVNLTPPSGGFKNTKRNVNQGGSLGLRDDMDTLLGKMY